MRYKSRDFLTCNVDLFSLQLCTKEEKLFVLEQGIEMEVGHTTVALESEQEEAGHVKRVYQICNHGPAQRSSVSRTWNTESVLLLYSFHFSVVLL